MKKLEKIIFFSLIFLLIATPFVCAVDTNYYEPGNLTDQDVQIVQSVTGKILAYVKYFGAILAVIMITIIGLKYILSSVDEKANYKETMFPLVVGCFLLAGATMLPSIIYNAVH